MKDPILLKKLLKEHEDGNVSIARQDDLLLFKYTMDCHIEGRWNDVNRLARGLIMKEDGEIVARPFPKFFNMGERSETEYNNLPQNETFEISEKLDGSMGSGYLLNGMWTLATPGSFESEQAVYGTQLLYRYKLEHLPVDCTPVFEIIYPENRIVVDYKGETFLSLLAIFEKNGQEWHSNRVDQIAIKCGFRRPQRFFNFMLNDLSFPDNFEGYVIRFEGGLRVKVKSPAYVRVHRLLQYMSPKGVIELIRGNEYRSILETLPKGIQQDFDDIRSQVQAAFDTINVRVHDALNNVPEGSRKDKALWIQANVRHAEWGMVFGLIDSKNIDDAIWRLVQDEIKEPSHAMES